MADGANRQPVVRPIALLARRDLVAAAGSFWPYGIVAAFCCISGLVFVAALVDGREASMRLFVDPFDLLVVLITPLVTARAFSDERRSGTAELLFTLPVAPWQLVAAKYLSAVGLLFAMIAATGILPLSLAVLSGPDWGPIATQYLGVVELVVAFAAVGVVVSLLSPSQALVAVVSVTVTLGLWFLGPLASSLSGDARSLLLAVSPRSHVESLNQGLLDLGDLTFFPSFAAVWLAVGAQLVKAEAVRR